MRNDAMTVGTTHGAFGDFRLGLLNALRAADIHGFGVAVKMVKVKCAWIVKSTINAANFCFVIADPVTNAFRSGVGRSIDLLSVARLLQPALTPFFSLLWVGLLPLWACSALTKSGAILSESFGLKLSQAMGAVVEQWGRIIVGFHGCMVSHPCKPDIFAATYEDA